MRDDRIGSVDSGYRGVVDVAVKVDRDMRRSVDRDWHARQWTRRARTVDIADGLRLNMRGSPVGDTKGRGSSWDGMVET